MKEQIQKLIANGNTEGALELLLQCGMNDAVLLQSQFNSGKKNFNLGLVEHSEWQRIQSRITYSALELASKLPNAQPTPTSFNSQPTHQQPVVMDNPLKRANRVFEEIQEDLDNFDYNIGKLHNYCAILDTCTNSQIFGNLMDFAKLSDWKNTTSSQRNEKVKAMLELVLSKKDSVIKRLKQFVQKSNNEVELGEALNLFRKKPNSDNWKLVYDLLFERFSDTTLFDPKVSQTWFKWDDKFSTLKTELDWGLEFKGSQDEVDIWDFIKVNSQIKNFNYN